MFTILCLRTTQHTTTVPVRINGALYIKFSYVFILVLTTHCTIAFDWHNSCFDSCVSCLPYEYVSVGEGVSHAHVYLCVYVFPFDVMCNVLCTMTDSQIKLKVTLDTLIIKYIAEYTQD